MILKDFFINFCILCTVIFLLHAYFHTKKIDSLKPIYSHALMGLFHGLFGVVLMQFGIHIGNGVLIDLRSIPMMISAQVGGWTSTIITTIIIITARLLFYPITYSSLINIMVLLVAAVAFSCITSNNMSKKRKWIYMGLSFITIIALSIHLVIPNFKLSILIFIQYAISIAVATISTHLITAYLWRNRDNYELLREYAQKDHLTGLYNNRSFDNFLNQSMKECQNTNQELSLLLMDIDFFKSINDTYGHPAGDEILKQVSYILKDSCRLNDKVFRIGGEEFSIVMPCSGFHSARKLAKRIQKRVEQHVFMIHNNMKLTVTISIGYATANEHNPLFAGELISQADKGLYKAKQAGRNQIANYIFE